MKTNTLGYRLKAVLDEKGISNYRISKDIKVAKTTITNYIEDNVDRHNSSILDRISQYLNISKEWLVTGQGDKTSQYKNEAEIIHVSEPTEQIPNKNGNIFEDIGDGKYRIFVKKVPVKAFGSYISDFQDSDFFEELKQVSFTVDHIGRGRYICFEVQGNSMNGGGINDAPEGAELLCRELLRHHWKDGFRDSVYGWVIVHTDTVLYKDIKDFNPDTGEIVCGSRSGLPQHRDFTISLNEVREIWKVIKRMY